MFLTTIDAAPRNGVVVPSSTAGAGRAAFEALPAAGFSLGRGGGAGDAVGRAAPVRAARSGAVGFDPLQCRCGLLHLPRRGRDIRRAVRRRALAGRVPVAIALRPQGGRTQRPGQPAT
jgi:hypothetical protein